MKRKRYSVEPTVATVKQHELGTPVADICRKLGIAEGTFYRWKQQYGGLEPNEAGELKQLREENAKLKKLVADLSPDKAMLQDVASKSGERAAAKGDGTLPAGSLWGELATSLSNGASTAGDLQLCLEATAAGGTPTANSGTGKDSCEVWLQADPCSAAKGRHPH